MSMTCTQDMLVTAAKTDQLLEPEALEKISTFLLCQQNTDGGFNGRTSASDLYYTLFAMASLFSLKKTVQPALLQEHLASFSAEQDLDFVHLASLARCRASLPFLTYIPTFIKMAESPLAFFAKFTTKMRIPKQNRDDRLLLDLLEAYRSADGGFHHHQKQSPAGSVYAVFLAYLAYQDLGMPLRHSQQLIEFVQSRQCGDGSFANDPGVNSGATTTTAAALVLLAEYNKTIPAKSIDCLLSRMTRDGGFLAGEQAPAADLLSTATALYALKRAGYPMADLKDANLAFIGSLWNEDGGFSGNPFDDISDCEYTFYALLAMGSLL